MLIAVRFRKMKTFFPQPLGLSAALVAGVALLLILARSLVAPVEAAAKERKTGDFKYVGGTEKLPEQCRGKLEVTAKTLVFVCGEQSVEVPYDSIELMQYRSDVSGKLHSMDLSWVLHPWSLHHKANRYFTIVYTREGKKHALVLDVPPDTMRPYLAEIELRSGRRVDVESHQDYDY